MRETIKLAKEAGIKAIALMGEPNYYPRFGFVRGAECGITDAQGNTFDALMCLPLCEDFSQVKGKLIESADFEKLEDEKNMNIKNYFYKFDVPIPGWDHPGKFHSVDLWFFFETLAKCWRPFTGVHYDVARQICDYLCNFIKCGDPNGKDLNGQPLPQWEPFEFEKENFMEFTTGCAQNRIPVSDEMKKYL